MSRVTALQKGKRREKKINVFLDGKYAFSLGPEVAIEEKLQVGQELSAAQVGALTGKEKLQHCLEAAYRYLSYRPRSEWEIRGRMQRRGFAAEIVDLAVAILREQGLLDDETFARLWKENRESFSPRSQWLTKMELRRKGVADNVIEQTADGMDDRENAYRAALQRTRRGTLADYQTFRRRLGDYLRRRGFNYEIIGQTLERVWRERRNGSG